MVAPLLLGPAPAIAKRDLGNDWPLKDFGKLGYYAEDNATLLASRARVDVVFMGDSITEDWSDFDPAYFANGFVDRGIGGETSSQMVLRMRSDVVDLKPRAVHIMAGTNDVAGNTGPMSSKMTEDNFRMMSEIATANGIKVLIASVPPSAAFPWRPGLEVRKPIAELNGWLKDFASSSGATWVDYWPALDDGSGAMKPALSRDGVHPSEAGYQAMEAVVTPILQRVLS